MEIGITKYSKTLFSRDYIEGQKNKRLKEIFLNIGNFMQMLRLLTQIIINEKDFNFI